MRKVRKSGESVRIKIYSFLKVTLWLCGNERERRQRPGTHDWQFVSVLQPGTFTPLRPVAAAEDSLLYASFLSFVILHTSVLRKSDGDILNGARREYRQTRIAQTKKCRHSYMLIALMHTHSHTHTRMLTRYCLTWRWIEYHCHRETMRRRENKNTEKVKVRIHQMDHFVLYNTLCCFASDRQPLQSSLLRTEWPFWSISTPVTMHHIMSHKGCTYCWALSLNEFWVHYSQICVNLNEHEQLPRYSKV